MPVIHDGKTYYTPDEVSAHLDRVIDEQSEILRTNLRKKREKMNSHKSLQTV